MNRPYLKRISAIAIPCALQSLLQSSFSLIDQMMVGQLGQIVIAGIGASGKFSMIFNMCCSAGIAGAASIMIAQYMGQSNRKKASRSYFQTMIAAVSIGVLFFLLCLFFSRTIISLYSKDEAVRDIGTMYLRVYGLSFPALAVSCISAAWLRCSDRAFLVLWSAVAGAITNTVLNWYFIFHAPFFASMQAAGAAWASVIAQFIMAGINIFMIYRIRRKQEMIPEFLPIKEMAIGWKAFLVICVPIVVGEVLWALAENIYTMIYGNMSTQSIAAMTITSPVQSAYFGILSGLGQAACILIGERLGQNEKEKAYHESLYMMKLSFLASLVMAAFTLLLCKPYLSIYKVDEATRSISMELLIVFAVYSLVKVQNMVIGGGILRSGGKTRITLAIDLIGTWCFGVPLAIISSQFWHLPIVYVYAILSFEEVVRYLLSLYFFKKKKWMETLA